MGAVDVGRRLLRAHHGDLSERIPHRLDGEFNSVAVGMSGGERNIHGTQSSTVRKPAAPKTSARIFGIA
jgi:hypothetical protein